MMHIFQVGTTNIKLLNIALNIYQLRMKNRIVTEQISNIFPVMIISLKRCYRTVLISNTQAGYFSKTFDFDYCSVTDIIF